MDLRGVIIEDLADNKIDNILSLTKDTLQECIKKEDEKFKLKIQGFESYFFINLCNFTLF